MNPNQNPSPNQNQNNPSPNQIQNTPPQNQQPLPGFGAWSNLLHHGVMSPMIPNQPQFTPTSSPPIQFHQLQQNINPQTTYFSQNFNDPRTFRQPEFDNPDFYGGGSCQQPSQQHSQPPHQEEVVLETQMPQPKPKSRKKAPRKKATTEPQSEPQSDAMPWCDDELVALADAWCTTSLDEIRGNSQKTDNYWKSIREKMAATLGKPKEFRTVDSLTSKWTQMKAKLTKFNGIYMKISRNIPSGWNELKILEEAERLYMGDNRRNPFTLKNVWNRIRFEHKWIALQASNSGFSSGSKRSHGEFSNSMGSDGRVNVDLNDVSDAIPDDEDVAEVNPLHTRPKGRDKAKRIQKFGDMQEEKAKHREKIVKSMEAYQESLEEKKARRAKFEADQKELIEQQRLINHLTIMEKGGLDDEDVEMVHEVKKESRSWLKKFLKK